MGKNSQNTKMICIDGVTFQGSTSLTSPLNPLQPAMAYGSGSSSFFFRVYGSSHPTQAFEKIQPGWTVYGHPTWLVTSVVPDASDNNESCTITGGTFENGVFYSFTGTSSNGLTIEMAL